MDWTSLLLGILVCVVGLYNCTLRLVMPERLPKLLYLQSHLPKPWGNVTYWLLHILLPILGGLSLILYASFFN